MLPMFTVLQFVTMSILDSIKGDFFCSLASMVTYVTNVYNSTVRHMEPLRLDKGRFFLLCGFNGCVCYQCYSSTVYRNEPIRLDSRQFFCSMASMVTYVTNVTNVYSSTVHHNKPLRLDSRQFFLLCGFYGYQCYQCL